MSTDNLFFDETREQSIIKANIVSSYFWAWAKVIIPAEKKRGGSRVAYIDLFAGPGRYKDGTKSTPLLVLERAIRDPEMREGLVTMFNDKDENNSRSLEQVISELPHIEKLKYRPEVRNKEVGQEIVAMFSQMRLIPTLFFTRLLYFGEYRMSYHLAMAGCCLANKAAKRSIACWPSWSCSWA
jgi:three-Cys-motif partner protein